LPDRPAYDHGGLRRHLRGTRSCHGKKPSAILGKPNPLMIRGILRQHALDPQNLAIVGDRLYTDMAMAHRAGALGAELMFLTGELMPTKPLDVRQART